MKSDRQFFAAQNMEMQVLHGLACVLTHVGDDAVAVVQALLLGQLADDGKDVSQQCAVFFGQRSGRGDVLLGTTRKCTLACGLMS